MEETDLADVTEAELEQAAVAAPSLPPAISLPTETFDRTPDGFEDEDHASAMPKIAKLEDLLESLTSGELEADTASVSRNFDEAGARVQDLVDDVLSELDDSFDDDEGKLEDTLRAASADSLEAEVEACARALRLAALQLKSPRFLQFVHVAQAAPSHFWLLRRAKYICCI
jgi:hypothetical protein